MPKPVYRVDSLPVSEHSPHITWGMLFDRQDPPDYVKIVEERLIPLLEKRYPGCPLKVSSAYYHEVGQIPKNAASIKWSWDVWVHGLPLRITSWHSLADCANNDCELIVEGDHGGTPGHADLRIVNTSSK